MHIRALITASICAIRALTPTGEQPKVQLKMTWWRYALGVLLNAALLGGCADGGQTGQPTAASGCQEPVALDAAIDGVSGQQLLDAFFGTYSATLHWQDDAFAPPDEELTLRFAPSGNEAAREGISYPCYRLLRVSVAASLTFADGSEVGSGNAMLSAPYGSFAATLSFNGGPWVVNAELSRAAGHGHIEGDLKRDGDAGLTSGVFSGRSNDGRRHPMKNGKLNAWRIIGAVLHGCALLAAAFGAACSDGSHGDDACAAYACVNEALLTGSVALPEGVTLVNVQLCAEGACHCGTLDLRPPDTGERFLRWGFHSHVCLTPSVTPGTVAVDALGEFASDAPPVDVSFQLVLTDRSTGSTLVDETRTAKQEITREDNCHRCWQASATL